MITNQPQVFGYHHRLPVLDGGTLSQPRLALSQVNSSRRYASRASNFLHFDVEVLVLFFGSRRWIAAIVSQKKHPHGAIVFLSCDVKISKEAVALMSNYSRPSFMGHNNFGSRRAREIQQPPPEAGFGSMFGYAECRNAGKSSTNEDMAIHHSGVLPYFHTPYKLFAIFDGHGGWGVSSFAQRHFLKIFESVAKRHTDAGLIRFLFVEIFMGDDQVSDEGFWLNPSFSRQRNRRREEDRALRIHGSDSTTCKETVWVACSGDSGALACTRNDQDEIVKV